MSAYILAPTVQIVVEKVLLTGRFHWRKLQKYEVLWVKFDGLTAKTGLDISNELKGRSL
jgi:hypothetical protein